VIRDGTRIAPGSTLEGDVCIVGAGAAGITLAQKLAGSSLRVVLVESGTGAPDADTQRLAEGEVVGERQPSLDQLRLRQFGGTTNHWTGHCGPLTPFELEARPWVADSGWPIRFDELAPFYRAAHEVCDLGPFDYTEATWGAFAAAFPSLEPDDVGVALIQHSTPTRFGVKYQEALSRAQNVMTVLASNGIELAADASARTIEKLRVATLAGNAFEVRCRRYVLACGAIENARLLLASNAVAPAGLGNGRDLVGRCFMDHPRARPAGLLYWTDAAAERLAQYTRVDGVRGTLALRLGPAAQQRERITSSLFFAEASAPLAALPDERAGDVATARLLQRLAGAPAEAGLAEWWVRCEQSPNPDSRVTLGSERDALGMRRVVLDWRLQEIDHRTLERASRAYAEALVGARLARVKLAPWLTDPSDDGWQRISGDWHQMGTTRMAETAVRGVVDPDCAVFGIDNLYVAGASVFPTSGAINPTLTLVALALRLAEHLERS